MSHLLPSRRLRAANLPSAAWISAAYAALAGSWIWFSDNALAALVPDARMLSTLSLYKGWFFVGITAGLLFLVLQRVYGELERTGRIIFQREADRNRAEAFALDAERFAATMIESLPGIVYFYEEDGGFLRWNRSFEAISGYQAGEIARMHPLDFFAPEHQPRVRQRIEEVFASGESSVEAPLLSRDGTATPFLLTGRRVQYRGRRCLVGVGINISKRHQAEQALRALNESLEDQVAARTRELRAALVRAEAADRLKSAFLATMSHELRTPLNSILGFTGLLLEGLVGPLAPEQQKQLGMVQASARHLRDLINDVLDISKIEAGQMTLQAEPFNLREVLEQVVNLLQPQVEKRGLRLETRIEPGLDQMVGDRLRFRQILLNLLNNAVKFTEEGLVTLLAGPAPDAGGAPALRVVVRDTGAGIRKEDMADLFQPFHQVESGLTRQHEGTGLGLAICRRLASLMDGSITATSEFGRGSEFVLTLPLQPRPSS